MEKWIEIGRLLSVPQSSRLCHWGVVLLACLAFFHSLPQTHAQAQPPAYGNGTCNASNEACKPGLVIPMWLPDVTEIALPETLFRAIVYFIFFMYLFVGVAIASDRFMAGIEVITSKETELDVVDAQGKHQKITVRIWNETVANLTLMALGSSAPEIMLAAIEITHTNFVAGDLGPGTIVGSAAFNLFMITAICCVCIPDGEVRKIKHLHVFVVTALWSVFAYLWLLIIVSVTSPKEVEIWEAVLTFIFFPVTVFTSYVADRRFILRSWCDSCVEPDEADEGVHMYINPHGTVVASQGATAPTVVSHRQSRFWQNDTELLEEFERHRNQYIKIIRDLRHKYPDIDKQTLEEMAEMQVIQACPKSIAYYRILATRQMTAKGKLLRRSTVEKRNSMIEEEQIVSKMVSVPDTTQIFFEPSYYTVMENVGSFTVTVARYGGNLQHTVKVDYWSQDGTAVAGPDYVALKGSLTFQPGDTVKEIKVEIIDDDVFEEDEHFYIHLGNLVVNNVAAENGRTHGDVNISQPDMATVVILDDDHPGIFLFADEEMTVTENIGDLLVKVCRSSGARGCVAVPFHTVEGTAKAGQHFVLGTGEIYFDDDETEQYIKIHIVDDEEYEKTESFAIELDEPYILKKGSAKRDGLVTGREVEERLQEMAKPRRGEITRINIIIKESQEFKSVVDKLMKKANTSLVVGTSSWREQFVEAITVSAGDEEDDNAEEIVEKLPSCLDYVMHFTTLFWKVLFALIPPTDYWGGWACFLVSILMIGVLTAIIGDLAASFGCTVGLKDAITAISFVALGTSIPDTFASKVSAINDRYADSSIGNVTGSNAVNVFLGIGIAWSMAAIYHAAHGNKFYVDPGTLAFSVTVFCVLAFFCVVILILRRRPKIGGELGGPVGAKWATATIFTLFWLVYLLVSSLVSYCYIKGF